MPVRATQYFKCTPDANVPDEPSAPEIRGYVGADYARIEWMPAGDGGRPILYYDLTLDNEEPIRLPADQTTDGILARLYLPQSQKATLAVAVYHADGRLSGVSLTDITSASLTDGAITSPVKGQGTNAKIMLLESTKTLRPLCGSRLIPIQ